MDERLQQLRREYANNADIHNARALYQGLFRCGLKDEALKIRASLGYLEEIRALPRPTKEQCRAFAEYVADAHSWYKHLGNEGEPFYFYLAPWAGRGQDGKEFFAQDKFHYSDIPTKEHLERFGHWLYNYGNIPDQVNAECGDVLDVPPEFHISASWTRNIHGTKWPHPEGWSNNKPGPETPEEMKPFLLSNREREAKGLRELRDAWRAMNKFLETLDNATLCD
jgi:hypothetical protein